MSNMRLTFVIGDIHGMYDAFRTIMEGINQYVTDNNITDWKIITLGDYIDRGPDSRKVVEDLRILQLESPERFITLRGNHEQMLLDAMNDPYGYDSELFYMNGGKETMNSYGVSNLEDIPETHKKFYRETRHCYQDELRYFVHAGVSPHRPLSEQDNQTRLWIREGFLDHPRPFEKFIVHGHTPRFWDNYKEGASKFRLNLDFGAVYSGSLVCAIFNDCDMEPISYIEVKTPSRKGPL